MKFLGAPLVAAVLAAFPLAVAAQQPALTAKSVNLRAGPDRGYPVVAVLPPSAQVMVEGCMPDYRWCDVSFGYDRGWVYAGNLRYLYQQSYVPLPGIAPLIGIVVLGFALDDYWDHHYHDRPWYPQRRRWERFAYPVHPAPAPHFRPAPRPRAAEPGRPPPQPHPRPEGPQRRDAPAQAHPPAPQRQAPAQVHPAPAHQQAPRERPEGQDRREGPGERR